MTLVLLSFSSHAQTRAMYKSEPDELITIRKVSLLPVFDNLRGIYSRPIESQLIENLTKSHRWEYAESTTTGPILSPDELLDDPTTTKSVLSPTQADAYLSVGIVKGPSGISIKTLLLLAKDQKVLAQEVLTDYQRMDVESIKKQVDNMIQSLFRKVPYSGIVTSRQANRVTVNLGKADGVVPDQIVTVVQIIKLNRHPKFNFLISTEKEVLGKIKLLKVDDTLSFGRILTEKETGAIQPNAKIGGLDQVTYTDSDSLSTSQDSAEAIAQTPEGQVSFGKNPVSWIPQKKPSYGQVGAHIGLGQYKENVSTTPALDSSAPYYPTVTLDGELWLTPEWSMHAAMRQGVISTKNPVSGASPSELSHSLSSYEFLFGYNMRLGPSLNAPKVEGLFGFMTYRVFVDESSTTGLTTKTYSGFKFGIGGSYPLSETSPYSLGANLFFVFDPKLKESPSTSGSADNAINTFGGFLDKQISMNLKARFALNFELYSSDFSGGAASSSSQKHTSLTAGIYYLF